MADEAEVAAPIEQEAPAIETVATTPEPVDEPERIPAPDEVAAEAAEVVQPTDDDYEDMEWNGKTFKAPKGLKDGVLMQSDYTKKTQSVSERQKALDTREADIEQRHKATDEELNTRASLKTMDQTLAEYAKLTQADWDHHHSVDPMGTDKAWRDYQFLKEQRAEAAKTLDTMQTERTTRSEQDLANRVSETLKFAEKEIPGFKPELTGQLVEFAAKHVGIDEGTMKQFWGPQFYKLLYEARIGSMALQKQSASKPIPAAPIAPLATVGGKTTPATRVDLGSADMEAYVAARKQGVGGKALR